MDLDIVISEYTLEQAIADGILSKRLMKQTAAFTAKYVNDKPVVATVHLFNEVSHADLLDLWNKFILWRQNVMPTLPEVDRTFTTKIKGKLVWVDETDEAVTMMYPEDY